MASRTAQQLLWGGRAYLILSWMWIRVSMSYRTSFVVLTLGQFFITGLDFVAIVIMFANILLVLAITWHNIPEGLAVGVAFGGAAAGLAASSVNGAMALAVL